MTDVATPPAGAPAPAAGAAVVNQDVIQNLHIYRRKIYHDEPESSPPVSNERTNYSTAGETRRQFFTEDTMRTTATVIFTLAVLAVALAVLGFSYDNSWRSCDGNALCKQVVTQRVQSELNDAAARRFTPAPQIVAPPLQIPTRAPVAQSAPQRQMQVIGGQNPSGPAPGGKRLVQGRPGDPGCVRLPNGGQRCPNRWE